MLKGIRCPDVLRFTLLVSHLVTWLCTSGSASMLADSLVTSLWSTYSYIRCTLSLIAGSNE